MNKMVILKMVMGPLPQHLDGVALHLPQLPLLFKSCSRVPQLLAQLLCVRLQPDDDDDDYPANSHHDIFPPWWVFVRDDNGGNLSGDKIPPLMMIIINHLTQFNSSH